MVDLSRAPFSRLGLGSGTAATLSGGSAANNVTQLQALINASRVSNGGSGELRIASGSYRIDSTITLYAGDVRLVCDLGVKWLGENCGTNPVFSIQRYAYGLTPIVVMKGGLIQAYNAGIATEVHNTAGVGHSVFRAGSVAFMFDGTSGVHCSDILIQEVNCYDFDLSTDYTDNCYNHTYVDCRFRGNKGACINQLRANSYEAMRWVRCQLSACNYPFYLDLTTPGPGSYLGLGDGSAGGSLFLIDCIGDYYGKFSFYRGCNPETANCNNALNIRGGHWETDHGNSGVAHRIQFSGILNLSDVVFYEQGNTPSEMVRLQARAQLNYSNVTIIHGVDVPLSRVYNTLDTTSSTSADPTVRRVVGKGLRRNGAYSTPVCADASGIAWSETIAADNFVLTGLTLDLSGGQTTHFLGTTLNLEGDRSSAMGIQVPTTGQDLAADYAHPIRFFHVTGAPVTYTRGGTPLVLNALNVASFTLAGQGAIVELRKITAALGWYASIYQSDAQAVSGVYTPTLTNVANVAASTAYECQYLRVGNTVTVSGKVDVDPTLTATSTQLGISLPVASNFGTAQDCAGVAFAPGIVSQGAAILGDVTNDRAQMQWVAADVTNQAMYFTFSYQVI